jgi:hypothetical protein
MNRVGLRKATVVAFLTLAVASIVYSPIVGAQEAARAAGVRRRASCICSVWRWVSV